MRKKNVVVIGGGTGTSVVLTGLKKYRDELNISAVVTVADSGGSTGRLRDEFGFLPVGDLRQGLAALATGRDESWIRQLLLYRFEKGTGLTGHNLGNLLLTALQDITGSTEKALEVATNIFRVSGTIVPITQDDVQLEVTYEDGTKEVGEHLLDLPHDGKTITQLKTIPQAYISNKAKKVLQEATHIVIGPGDVYGSIVPNLIVSGVSAVMKQSKAKKIYVANLMTKYSQTHGMTAQDHLAVIESYLGSKVDITVINSQKIAKNILQKYSLQHEYPVFDDLDTADSVMRGPLIRLAAVSRQQSDSDSVKRSYLRHDPDKLAEILIQQF